MTKKERTLTAFEGREVDHVPVCMWKHVPHEYWADDDKFAEYQIGAYKATGVDFMKLSADKYFGWPNPLLNKDMTPADLYRVEPLGENHPYIRGQIRRTAKIVRGLGGECAALYLVFTPLASIRLTIGYDAMMRLIREDPEAMMYACDVAAEDQKALSRGLIQDAGADGIFYSVQNGEVNRFTENEYRRWIAPSDKAVLEYANGLSRMNAIHFCAWEGDANRLSAWSDYRAAVVSWSRYIDIMDIQAARKQFGCTVWGGFDNRAGSLIYTGSDAEIAAEVAALVAQGGKRGYILGADCSLRNELPDERIRFIAETARKY